MFVHSFQNLNIAKKVSEFLFSVIPVKKNRPLVLFVSGGSAIDIYTHFARSLGGRTSDVSFLTIAQVDERFQHTQDTPRVCSTPVGWRDQSNAQAIEKTGLWNVCGEKNISYHIIFQEGTLEEAANEYNETMKSFGFAQDKEFYKIALLGIGEDGHIAGLLPGYEKVWNVNSYAVGYNNSGKYPQRISLTPKALRLMNMSIIYAKGAKKQKVLKELLDRNNRKNLDDFPAGIFREIENVHLFTDVYV